MGSGQVAMSLGCAGNRIATGLRDEELYTAIPGPAWPQVVDALVSILEANGTMGRYYQERSARVAAL
jgi:uncharacterized protein (DUF169 family)